MCWTHAWHIRCTCLFTYLTQVTHIAHTCLAHIPTLTVHMWNIISRCHCTCQNLQCRLTCAWSMVHGLKFIYLHIVFTLYVCQTCFHFLQQPASKQTGQIKRPFLLIMTRTMIVMMMMVMMITVSRYCSTSLSLSSIIVTSIISSYHIISYHISLTDLVPPALCPSQGPVMRRRAAVVLASGVCVCLCLTCVCTCEPLMSSYVLLCVWLCVGLCLLWCLLARCLALACATIYDMSYVCHPHLHVHGNVISLKSIRKPLVWDQAKS